MVREQELRRTLMPFALARASDLDDVFPLTPTRDEIPRRPLQRLEFPR